MTTDQESSAALAGAKARRQAFLDHMAKNEKLGINCRSCTGKCCTFEANSMQVTPIELEDLYHWLTRSPQMQQDGMITLLSRCLLETMRTYGLDRPPVGDGRRTFSRRRYTCPFHVTGTFGKRFTENSGCFLPVEVKPYGCLGFNPTKIGTKDGESCKSRADLLDDARCQDVHCGPTETRKSWEMATNGALRQRHKLRWERTNLPQALLDRFASQDSSALRTRKRDTP